MTIGKAGRARIFLTAVVFMAALSLSRESSAYRWCGNPICPGDIVSDEVLHSVIDRLTEITDRIKNEGVFKALKEGGRLEINLSGQKTQRDILGSINAIGRKTESKTNIYNESVTRDMTPAPELACRILTWQDYSNTGTAERAAKILNGEAASTAARNLSGEGAMSARGKSLSLFQRMQGRNRTVDTIPDLVSIAQGSHTLTEDEVDNAMLAIDTLTNTNDLDVTSISRRRETAFYKINYVEMARRAYARNYMRMMLSESVYERSGSGNAESGESGTAPSAPSSQRDYLNDIAERQDSTAEEIVEERESPAPARSGGVSLPPDFASSPVNYTRISSPFSPARVNPVTGELRQHKGVDMAAPGGTPIYAPSGGDFVKVGVDSAGMDAGFGRMIIIQHDNGVQTWYGHLRGYAEGIRTGGAVSKGDLIGYVGNTGHSTGNHLHYEIRVNGTPIDPMGRYGVSQSEADERLLASGDDTPFDHIEDRSTATSTADGQTFTSEIMRKMLMQDVASLERAWKKFKAIERMNVSASIRLLSGIDSDLSANSANQSPSR